MSSFLIDHKKIYDCLKNTKEPDIAELNDILNRARELKGIDHAQAEIGRASCRERV